MTTKPEMIERIHELLGSECSMEIAEQVFNAINNTDDLVFSPVDGYMLNPDCDLVSVTARILEC